MLSFALLAAAAAPPPVAVTSIAPPPVVNVVAPPPPIISISPPMPPPMLAVMSPSATVPVTLDVAVSAGARSLYRGTLRVARGASANYSESVSQASAAPCADVRAYDGGERHSLSVQMHWNELPNNVPAVSLSVNWQRPIPGSACGERGARSVQLTQIVPLTRGHTEVIGATPGCA